MEKSRLLVENFFYSVLLGECKILLETGENTSQKVDWRNAVLF